MINDFFNPLCALMWRYRKVASFRYGHTFWQLFGSVTLFIIIYYLHVINRSELVPNNILKPENKLSERKGSLIKVFYEPYNSYTQRVMTGAEAYLNNNQDLEQIWEFESVGFPTNLEADSFKSTNGVAQVKFKNKEEFPTELDYSISAPSSVAESNLDLVFNGILQTVGAKAEVAPPYLGLLQWAIDKSYMEQLTHRNIDQDIKMTAISDVLKDELITLHQFILICSILGPLPYFLVFSSKLVVERRIGMKELLKHAGIFQKVRLFAYFLDALIASTIYSIAVTALLKVSDEPILPKSQAFIVGFTIAFHFVNTMCMAFVTSTLSKNIKYADCLACISYLATLILDFLLVPIKEHVFMLYCILPHAPICLFWDEVLFLERIGEGTQFSNINISHSHNRSVVIVWVSLFMQLFLTTLIAMYLDHVKPGYYGIAKKIFFFLEKRYWFSKETRKYKKVSPHLLLKRDEAHFQKVPKNAEIAVQVLNVSKVFKNPTSNTQVVALNSVTFDCCKGEVTMLLGANGAGKSTLLLIVAGLISASEGGVFVEGYHIGSRIKDRRNHLRICMQKNICFRFLTVKENIMFFRKLRRTEKGFSVDYLLKKLKLIDKSDHYGYNLSDGTMKCLQVACVLVGDADVLILDEPTTGMEMAVRLSLWDLIMVLRGNKTILMSTSCLHEAVALGDRIVLLDRGVLKCHGSPMFLKNVIGTCFNLSIIIQDSARLYDLKEFVDNIIPELECHIHDMKRIVFSVPIRESENFPQLLESLEDNKTTFGIILMDVGMFMDEVFHRFIDAPVQETTLGVRKSRSGSQAIYNRDRLRGYKLKCRQIKLLILRFFDDILLESAQFLTLRFLIPIICLLSVTLTSSNSLRHKSMFSDQKSLINTNIGKLIYNVAPSRRSEMVHSVKKFPGIETVSTQDIDREFNSIIPGYSTKETIGFEISDAHSRIIHPSDPRITSKTVNIFSNIYMSMFFPQLNNTIRTTYEHLAKLNPPGIQDVKSSYLCLKWTSWVTFLSMFPLAPTVILGILERKYGIRDNHMMAGCTPIIHWSSRLIAHMIIFLFVVVLPLLIMSVFMDLDRTFLQPHFLGCLTAMLLMFGLAFHPLLFVMSFMLHEFVAICQIYIISLFSGIVLPVFLAILELFADYIVVLVVPYYIVLSIARLSPMYALGVGLARITLTARLNAFCKQNKLRCPNLTFDDKAFDVKICCNSTTFVPFPYLKSNESGLYDIITLFIQFIVYSILVILLEYRILQTLKERISFLFFNVPARTLGGPSVQQEKKRVEIAIKNKNYKDDILLVNDIYKYYTDNVYQRNKKKIYAVRGISYATKLGECLAILGTQSAGKTTLMNILAGNTVTTRGEACIGGTFLSRDRMKYIHKISLSSNSGGMDEFMTGMDNLIFVAKLQGHSERTAFLLAYKALQIMDLLSLADKSLVKGYSSGCLRRLSLCCVLVLSPVVALLDQPMTEIDSNSQSLVAKALQYLKKEPATIIVSEKTMDWTLMQPVFDRIAIMAKGQFAIIGPAEYVLSSVTKGFSARIKLKMVTAYRKGRYHSAAEEDSDSDDTDQEEISKKKHTDKSVMFAQSLNKFKDDFLKSFKPCRLCSEHLCMLFYHIEDADKTRRYSVMFKKLDELKVQYDELIEDYYLSFTTVEDLFWTLEYEIDPVTRAPTIKPKKEKTTL